MAEAAASTNSGAAGSWAKKDVFIVALDVCGVVHDMPIGAAG